MTYIEDCQEKFNRLPDDIKSRLKSQAAVQTTAEIKDQYKIDADFVITLVMIGELAIKDIPEYLSKKYRINRDNAVNIKDELVNKIFKSILDNEELSALNPVDNIKEIFQYKILSMMQEDKAIVKEINDEIIFLIFTKDLLNQDELVQILSANQELLTAKKFVLDNKAAAPTVANWIKDFIKYQGVEFFDLVILSRYLTSSANAKILDEDERRQVIKLLKVYRNLKFFPLSMSDDVDEWEIFPIEKEETLTKARTVTSSRLKSEIPSAADQLRKAIAVPSQPSLAGAFREFEKFYDNILKKEDNLMVQTKGNVDKIKKQLASAARSGDRATVVACLKILARDGSLKTVLRDHQAWLEATAESMRKKYKSQYDEKSVEQMIINIKHNPNSTPLLSEFLQYILKTRAKLSDEESALVAMDLGQAMDGEKQKFSYGNEATGQFEWVKHKIVNGQLMSEL